MIISLIAAVAENGLIGRNGELPWHLSSDLRRFKKLTLDHDVIMGRRTYESIGHPLPRRRIIVVSTTQTFSSAGVSSVATFPAALEEAAARGADEVFIAGGSRIYAAAISLADRLLLTRIQANVDGNVYFPKVDWDEWQLVEEEITVPAEGDEFKSVFCLYQRIKEGEKGAGTQETGTGGT